MTKIAFASDDGVLISQHFGKAPYYVVAAVKDNGEDQTEIREKWHHAQHDHAQPEEHSHSHDDMFATIQDCQILVVGGMGEPAYQSARQHGLEVILTGEKDINLALQIYHAGGLASDPSRVHAHR